MRKRLGFFGILISYCIFLFTLIFFCFIGVQGHGGWFALCLISGVILLLLSIWMTAVRYDVAPKESKLDDWLRKLCFFPALLVITLPCFLFSAIMITSDFIAHNFRRKVKALRKKGFSCSKTEQGGKKVYSLQKGDCVIRIIPDESYQISVNGGETFENIVDSVIGTKEEREELKRMIFEYNNCDYRDKDLYDLTRAHVRFILDNINTIKAI